MSIEVIGAGFGRTGTTSLKAALERLGFDRCYHMIEVIRHPGDARIWERAMRGEPTDWDALFRGYRATVDWPGCTFYRELMRRYPDAKVILTVRDSDAWYDSAYDTIYRITRSWLMRLPIRVLLGPLAVGHMTRSVIWDGTFQGRFGDRQYAIDVYNRHNAEVQQIVPADQLLVFDVRQGWEPLCRFLDVPVPDAPFPRLNEKRQFQMLIAAQRFASVVPLMAIAAGIGLAAWRRFRPHRSGSTGA